MHQLTFLFAALHARQAVEFFFGLLTAVVVCGANMRGGPGASAGNCFVFSWGVIFIPKKISLADNGFQNKVVVRDCWPKYTAVEASAMRVCWWSNADLMFRVVRADDLLYSTEARS
jgi:hypothetical protein